MEKPTWGFSRSSVNAVFGLGQRRPPPGRRQEKVLFIQWLMGRRRKTQSWGKESLKRGLRDATARLKGLPPEPRLSEGEIS